MKNKIKIIVFLALILVGGLVYYFKNNGKNEGVKETSVEHVVEKTKTADEEQIEKVAVPNIILKDQYGKEHNLEDYKGKVVFINFWATWCGYCVEELPYLEKVAKNYSNDIVVLGIAGPKSKDAPRNPDVSKDEIIEFLKKKNITYPVLFDETGTYFAEYGIKFFPTSFVVGRDGYLDGYIPGGVSEENLIKIVEEAIKK